LVSQLGSEKITPPQASVSIISNEIVANALSKEHLKKFSGKKTQKTETFAFYIESIYTTTGYTAG
jgi:hypothetical protein